MRMSSECNVCGKEIDLEKGTHYEFAHKDMKRGIDCISRVYCEKCGSRIADALSFKI